MTQEQLKGEGETESLAGYQQLEKGTTRVMLTVRRMCGLLSKIPSSTFNVLHWQAPLFLTISSSS